ncbi:FtsW/RodA/SpoVE family cell cycle protein [Propionibacteriaceae bacterium G57]|uniref:FtsW/RodA/SpoVE family cell cycle protein n=1 Tax=Aestuariimicrobium sp. G57 TaxID=3418485 RepID=UPI003DA70E7F
MLLVACALGLGGWLLTGLNLTGQIPDNWGWVCGLWLGMALAAHLVIRFAAPYADPLILPCVIALNGLGLAMIHRIDQIPTPPRADAYTQFIWTGLGMVLFALVVIFIRDLRRFDRFPYLLFLAGLGLLLLPLVPGLGVELNGSRIWIRVAGYSFQPSEVAKILLAFAFASYLVAKREVLALSGFRFGPIQFPRLRDLLPIGLMWAAAMAVLVFQSDLGTALLFFGLFVMMLYVATERIGWVVIGVSSFAVGALAAYQLFGHVRVRVSAWLNPFENFDQNLQVISAQYGFAWGGLTGRGWGLGRPGLTPLAKSDFISAAIGEELGIAGLMAIILIYAILVSRGLRAALSTSNEFTKLLACGLSFVFALQVFAIIGGVTRLLPLTGLTTPFMSQGGSSLVANWVIIGILIVISHNGRKPVAVLKHDPMPEQVALTSPSGPTGQAGMDDETQVVTP